ncbi:hypothetical protein Hanom_Chr07g00598131 [Helianthus anomalus]
MEEECNDEVESEGKDLNSAEPAVEVNKQVDAENSNIHEVFSQHLNEGSDGMKKKKNRRKEGLRRKSRASKSVSPSGQERPQKRQREGEDPFDVDRLIFVVNNVSAANEENKDNQDSEVRSPNFLTLELNRQAVTSEEGPRCVKLGEGITEEVNETIELNR